MSAAGKTRDAAAAWERARTRYSADAHLPLPTWATRGLPDGPARAWQEIAGVSRTRSDAISVYVHVPFCRTRCPFCDCHATVAPRGDGALVGRYIETLVAEIRAFGSLPGMAERPVTTVHFGGGTPLEIGRAAFTRVVETLRESLGTHPGTEWALETTSRLLDDGHLELLSKLGFTRVHVGVQSLSPAMRRTLGRREPRDVVLERIGECLRRGWVVSADLLYGLPGQTAAELMSDIDALVGAGIHGVSLYHLNAGPYNTRFMERHGLAARDEARLREDFLLLAEGSARLEAHGLVRNHVTHFALPADGNLYSRHALRGEDLVAMGSSADGVIGGYMYRHVELEAYLPAEGVSTAGAADVPVARSAAPAAALPPLAGGGSYTPDELQARPLVCALMAAEVDSGALDGTARAFCEGLAADGLLEREAPAPAGAPAGAPDIWRLTTTGSWFSGAICAEAWRLYAGATTSR